MIQKRDFVILKDKIQRNNPVIYDIIQTNKLPKKYKIQGNNPIQRRIKVNEVT